MKALKVTGIVLAGVTLIVVVLGLILPKSFKVERSIVIPSNQKEVVFKNLSNWSEFVKWDPWSTRDKNIKLSFSGEEGKIGSSYSWKGNDSVGEGDMKITALAQNQFIESDLHFIKPFKTTNKTVFSMSDEKDGIKVTWSMSGSTPFPINIFMNLFFDMDKQVGGDFDKGLNRLKDKTLQDAALINSLTNNTDSTTIN